MLVKTSLEAEVGGSEFGSQSDYKVGGRGVMTGLFATNNYTSDIEHAHRIFLRDGMRERKVIAMKPETNLNCFPLPHRYVWLNYGRLDHTV